MDTELEKREAEIVYMRPRKSTGVAVFLSFLLPGLGSAYAGSWLAGSLIFALWLIGVLLSFILIGIPIVILAWIIGLIHSATAADKAQ